MNEEFKIFTKKELLINWRNQLFDALVKSEINLKFHVLSLKLLKEKDPEYKVVKKRIEQTEKLMSDYIRKLELIDEAIKNEKA